MKFILASNNEGKIREFKSILSDHEIISLKEAGITADVEENGSTFEENSLIKAKAIFELTGIPAISDDSGLCVDVLNGEPGIYSARYAGESKSDEDNIDKLLDNLKDYTDDKRTAKFVSVVTAYISEDNVVSARGECEGIIIRERRGNGGFGYDPIFLKPELSRTFSQLTAEEKNEISHRRRAIENLKVKLLPNTKER